MQDTCSEKKKEKKFNVKFHSLFARHTKGCFFAANAIFFFGPDFFVRDKKNSKNNFVKENSKFELVQRC